MFKTLALILSFLTALLFPLTAQAGGLRYLTVTFDDGWDVPAEVWDMFDQAGIAGTLFVNTQPLDESWGAYMTWVDVVQASMRGWEIGSHSVTHGELPQLWAEPMIEEMLLSKLRILQMVGEYPHSFSVPFGSRDARVDWFLDRYYDSAVNAWGNYGMNPQIDPMRINRQNVNEDIAAGWLCSKMREIPDGGWYVLMFHKVGVEGDDYSCTMDQMRQIIDCIVKVRDENGVMVDTITGVIKRAHVDFGVDAMPYPEQMGP